MDKILNIFGAICFACMTALIFSCFVMLIWFFGACIFSPFKEWVKFKVEKWKWVKMWKSRRCKHNIYQTVEFYPVEEWRFERCLGGDFNKRKGKEKRKCCMCDQLYLVESVQVNSI